MKMKIFDIGENFVNDKFVMNLSLLPKCDLVLESDFGGICRTSFVKGCGTLLDLFRNSRGFVQYDYYYDFLKLYLVYLRLRKFGVVDFSFIGIDVDRLNFERLDFSVGGDGFANFSYCGVGDLMVGGLRFGCLEQLIIGRIGSGFKVNENYWSRFKKFLVGVGLLRGGKGGYLGFDDELISGLFESGLKSVGGSSSLHHHLEIGLSLSEFFRYGLRENDGGFNWKVGLVSGEGEIVNSSLLEENIGNRKMVFEFNPYVNFVDGEVYWDKNSFDLLKNDFVSGRITEDEFLRRRVVFGGSSQHFYNSLVALQLDDYFINSSLGDKCDNSSSFDIVSGRGRRSGTFYRNRLDFSGVGGRTYISYERIAELLGYANKSVAWHFMRKQDSVIMLNDRVEFDNVVGVIENFGLGIQEVLSEDDFEMKRLRDSFKKSKKVDKKSKKDDDLEDDEGGILNINEPINPVIGPISGMDLIDLDLKIAEKSVENFAVENLLGTVNVFGGENSVISENFIKNSDEKVVYYEPGEKLTEEERLWLRGIFGHVIDGMREVERIELFRCMMAKEKDAFGSFTVRRFVYRDVVENPVWRDLYSSNLVRELRIFRSNGNYYRWNLEFEKSSCLESKNRIDVAEMNIVKNCYEMEYFDVFGNLVSRFISKKKLVSEFGIFGLVNKLMNEIGRIGIVNFRKSRGLSSDFVENLRNDCDSVEDFNDILEKMYLPCRVYRNKKGLVEVNYISSINRIGQLDVQTSKLFENPDSMKVSENVFSDVDKLSIDEYNQVFLDKEKYRNLVRNLSEETYELNSEFLNPRNLVRSLIDSEFTCQLDHKYSIENGFKNGVCPRLLASKENLEILSVGMNRLKSTKNSISLEYLQDSVAK